MSSVACSRLPNLRTLTGGLASVLRSRVTVIDRQPNIYASTFPSEVVTCRVDGRSELLLFCKYGAGHGTSLSGITGHKGGVPYEAAVYRHVLHGSRATTPTFYGAYRDVKTGHTWLILEYLDQSLRVSRCNQMTETPAPMSLAARWIGQFHRLSEERERCSSLHYLIRYDTEYYLEWARRTSLFAGHLRPRFPWLTTLCRRFEDVVTLLLASPPTVIHGEYYPGNILCHGGTVYPVDWESTAVAAGEIDLAALTDGWPAEIVRQCELEYQRVRWPAVSPANFGERLWAAQIYLHFRWLCHDFTVKGTGDEQLDWSPEAKGNLFRLEQLRSLGERLGLIEASSSEDMKAQR